MLTVSDEEDDLFEAIKAGASGYLLKEISIEEVGDAVRVGDGRQQPHHPVDGGEAPHRVQLRSPSRPRPAPAAPPRLTDRELQVLRLIATGMSNREIAGELTISENTVKNHVRNILEKLHLHSRVEAVMYALRENIIDLT